MSEISLPPNWESCEFGDIARIRNGYAFKSELFKKSKDEVDDVPLIRQSQLKGSKIDLSDAVYLSAKYLDQHSDYSIEKGDIIIGMSGSIGKVCRYEHSIASLQNQRTGKVELHSPQSLDANFLGLFLSTVERTLVEKAKGMGIQNISGKDIAALPFSLPPLNEQTRIVAKIEELFSELDAGEESLRKARRQLGVYRQSLLKQAFEGKLTAAWREQNPQLLESPELLFASVQSEREARYQKQFKDWEASRSKGKRTSKPAKPVTLTPFDRTELTDRTVLPEGWLVIAYGDLCSVVRNGISQKPTGDSGYKIARISAVRPMFFDYGDYRYISCDEEMAEDFALESGDLVFTRYNGARRYVGVCAHFTGKESCLYPDKLIRTRPDLPSLDASFLELALNSGLSRAWLETKIRTTAGQSGVSGGDIKAMPVAFCSLAEQQEIVRLLDEQFTVIEQNEREIDTALKRSEALRQSILKKAFSGQLVAQDPADEPAGVLLERIRAEREAAMESPRKLTRTPKTKPAPEIEEESVLAIAPVQTRKPKPSTPGKTDLQAGIVALTIAAHENGSEHLGHVKAEKIVHLCDVIARLQLDRHPVKDAAGPNDFPQAKKVEHRAKMQGWFTVTKKTGAKAYNYQRGRNFDRLVHDTEARLGPRLQTLRDLISDRATMSVKDAELVATVHAAWNNLILAGESQPSEESIVKEARENWHPDKLKIPRQRFFDAIAWIEGAEVIPTGTEGLVQRKPSSRSHHA